MLTADCFICRKLRAEIAPPPGGYLWEDKLWAVCHAPADIAGAGTLILESRQHFLDLEDMPADERASLGPVLGRLYPAIRRGTGADRVYLLSTMGGVPHFHAWLFPGGLIASFVVPNISPPSDHARWQRLSTRRSGSGRRWRPRTRNRRLSSVDMNTAFALIVPLITTAITTNKIIAGVVVLIIIVAAVFWWSRRRGAPPT